MNCKKWLFSLLLLISSGIIGFSQTGPAGVGSSSSIRFWYRADRTGTVLTNGQAVSTWSDLSGNSSNATGVNGPVFLQNGINGLPSVSFSGVGQYFNLGDLSALTEGEAFVVTKATFDPPSSAGLGSLWHLGAAQNTFYPFTDGNLYESFGSTVRRDNIVLPPNVTVPRIYNVISAANYWEARMDGAGGIGGGSLAVIGINSVLFPTAPRLGSNAIGDGFFSGAISEVFLFSTRLNTAQRVIVENYLSSRYRIVLPNFPTIARDKYFFDDLYPHDVAGVGQQDATNQHLDALSAGILGVSNPTNLDPGEYLLFGHNNAAISSWSSTNVPNNDPNVVRVAREWRFDQTGGDPGTVTVRIDPTQLPAVPAGYVTYYLMIDADGDFNTGAQMVRLAGSPLQATGVSIPDGSYVAIAAVKPIVEFAVLNSFVQESVATTNVAVRLNYPSSVAVSVPFTASGTATAVTDYNLSASPLAIAAGQPSANIVVSLVNDAIFETNELLTLTLGVPVGATPGTATVHNFTIFDNDGARTVAFTAATYSAAESVGTFNLPVALSASTGSNTVVSYEVIGGTAVNGSDYVLAAGSVTVLAGATTANIPVTITDDVLFELPETIVVRLTNVDNNTTIGIIGQAEVTITDNDIAPVVRFTSNNSVRSESVGQLLVTVQLSAASGRETSVTISGVNGTAIGLGVDFTVPTTPMVIPAGATTANLVIQLVDDFFVEPDENFSVVIQSAAGATLGTPLTHFVTINDNDPATPPRITWSTASTLQPEGTAALNLVATLTPAQTGTVTVLYAINPISATYGSDFSAAAQSGVLTFPGGTTSVTLPITITNDVAVESDEIFTVSLVGPSGIVLLGANPIHTVTISDNDNLNKIGFGAISSSQNEDVSPIAPVIELRDGGGAAVTNSTGSDITVSYSVVGGSATNGTDYVLAAGVAVIPNGSSQTTISINITDDLIDEPNQTIIVRLSNPVNANLRTSFTDLTHTIVDNDNPPRINFTSATNGSSEGVSLSPVSLTSGLITEVGVSAPFTVTAVSATAGTDFVLANGTVTIPANGSTANINVTLVQDALIEGNETFSITLTGPNAGITTPSTVFTIFDDDFDGFTGPGGVGNAATNRFWYRADQLSGNPANGDPITTWPDQSGNSVNATGVNSPTFAANGPNGRPSIAFNGLNQYFTTATLAGLSQGEAFIVPRINVDPPALDIRTALWHLGGGASTHYPWTNGNLYESFGTNIRRDNIPIDPLTQLRIYNAASRSGLWENRLDGTLLLTTNTNTPFFPTNPRFGTNSGTNLFLDGFISEVIMYSTVLNNAQRIIVENYLSSKFAITIPADRDKYVFESTHRHDVAGIGREDATNRHESAFSAAVLGIGTPSNLNDGEYFLFGHDNGAMTWSSTEVPTGNTNLQRIAREWRFYQTNSSVGTLTITIDPNKLPALPIGFLSYVVLVDADGDFTSGATSYPLSGTNQATNVTIPGGSSVTIAVARPRVEFAVAASQVSEGAGTVSVTVQLNYPVNSIVTIPFSLGGSALTPDDYSIVSANPLVLAPGATTGTIQISLVDDASTEPDETIELTLQLPTGVTLGTTLTHTVTVNDNDETRKVEFDVAAVDVAEAVGNSSFRVRLSNTAATNVTVGYAVVGGTATLATDFVLANGTATILAGQLFVDVPFSIVQDAIFENNETILVRLNNPSLNAALGTVTDLTITIQDDDTPPVANFAVAASSQSEGVATLTVTVQLSAAPQVDAVIDYAFTDVTATGNGVDYFVTPGPLLIPAGSTTGQITVSLTDDPIFEGNEQFSLSLVGASGGATLTGSTIVQHLVTIQDNDNAQPPQVQWQFATYDQPESSSPLVLFAQLNYAQPQDLTVSYVVTTGTANTTDYTVSATGVLTIPAGSLSVPLNITIINDLELEIDETFTVRLSGPSGIVGLGANSNATIRINDDDRAINVGLQTVAQTVVEGVAPVVVQVQLTDDAGIPVVNSSGTTIAVNYQLISGTGTAGVDAVLAAGVASFAPGAGTAQFSITVTNDTFDEPDQTVQVVLSNPVNANLRPSFTTFTLTIQDNDNPSPASVTASTFGSEAVGQGIIPIRLTTTTEIPVTVNYTVTPGTASPGGVDYTLASGSVVIPVGASGFDLPVLITQDNLLEAGGETLTLTLTSQSPGTLGTPVTTTFRILEDDNVGFTGPAGVGDATINRFWLRADALALTNDQTVTTWTDQSGNATAVTAVNTPSFSVSAINGRPAIKFESAQSDFFNLPTLATVTQGEIFAVLRGSSPTSTASTGLWRFGNSSNSHYPWTDGRIYDEFGTNVRKDNILPGSLTQPRIYSVRSFPSRWENKLDGATLFTTGSNTVSFPTTPRIGSNAGGIFFEGLMSEVVFYSQALNTAQRLIVENYLAAKYNIDHVTDLYLFEQSHGNEVAGIGRVDASNQHLEAQGGGATGVLRIGNPSDLANGEFALFGHDNAQISSWVAQETPNAGADIQRVGREWRFDQTGDVGTVNVTVNTASLPAIPGGGYGPLMLLVDADGDFSQGATFVPLLSIGGGLVRATGVSIPDQSFITISVIRPVVQWDVATLNQPEQTSPATLTINLNYPLGTNATVGYAVQGTSTATAVSDYGTITPASPVTITAGTTSRGITIPIVDDLTQESDETIVLLLNSPGPGINIGARSTATVSIIDNDRTTRVGFGQISTIVDENDLSGNGFYNVNVQVRLFNQLNATIATSPANITVNYAVIAAGTTATPNVDFALASGTVTFTTGSSATRNIILQINDDIVDEADEDLVILLSNPTNANLRIDRSTFTATIVDDDPEPTLGFSSATFVGSESEALATLEVALTALSEQTRFVNYTVTAQTATSGADYVLADGSVTIPAGQLRAEIPVQIFQDNLIEGAETFRVDLVPAVGIGGIVTAIFTIGDDDNAGFTGPGGVGDQTNTRFWLRADALTLTDGQTVANWPDVSGNNSTVNAVNTPSFKLDGINGQPTVEFESVQGDYFTLPNLASLIQGEVYTVLRRSSVVGAAATGLWRLGGNGTADTHYPWTNGLMYEGFGSTVRKDNIAVASLTQPRIYTARSLPGRWESRLNGSTIFNTNSNTVAFPSTIARLGTSSGGNPPSIFFDGQMSEVVLYSQGLNQAQRLIVENYLAAKYKISHPTDLYAFEGNYGNDVAGIGRKDATNLHIAAQSAKILKVSSASDLNDEEYLLFGHDKSSVSDWTDVETPNSGVNIRRIAREWRFDHTGDVGTVSVGVSAAALPALPAGYTRYAVLVDVDGDFRSGATLFALPQVAPGEFERVGIPVPDQAFVTIAVIRPIIQWTATTVNQFEPSSPVIITAELNFPLDNDAAVDYTLANVTTSNADYVAPASGRLTISGGNLQTTFNITLVNDLIAEPDETLTVTLSNPSAGIVIGPNAVTSVSINDDDQPFNIGFAATTSQGPEGTPVALITVQLTDDNGQIVTNASGSPVTVNFVRESGTAIPLVDFNIASVTPLTIPNGASSVNLALDIIEDAVSETIETIVLRLSAPVGANLRRSGFDVHTFSITDNDPRPTMEFSLASNGGSEASGIGQIEVRLSSIAEQPISAQYAVTLITAAASDFTLPNGTVTIPAGSQSINITVLVNQDTEPEAVETFRVTLSGADVNLAGQFETIFTIGDDDNVGFVGPGGVGDVNIMEFWLKGDVAGTTVDNTVVGLWPDQSGKNATISALNSPAYRVSGINGRPAIEFVATESDHFNLPNLTGLSQGEIFSVLRANNDPPTATNSGLWTLGTSNSHYPWTNGNMYEGFGTTVRRDNLLVGPLAQPRVYNVRSLPGLWTSRLDGSTLFSTATNSVIFPAVSRLGISADPSFRFDGFMGEVVLFNQALNDAQRIIVDNYLAAKFKVPITNDFYVFETNHGNDVAGIGRTDALNFHAAAQSAGVLKVSSPASLGDGDFLLFGHDGAAGNVWTSAETPNSGSNIRRLPREWRIDQTGDVGTVTVGLNTATLPAAGAGYSTYMLMLDVDGDFSSGVSYYPFSFVSGTLYEVIGVPLADQLFAAIAVVRPELQWRVATINQFEPTSPAILNLDLNYPLDRDITVNYALANITASLSDYFAAPSGTMTITKGNLSSLLNITIVNDVIAEPDETFTATLSGPSSGVSLGAIPVTTVSINDDDQPFNIGFEVISQSGLESVPNYQIVVRLTDDAGTEITNATGSPVTTTFAITAGTATPGIDALLVQPSPVSIPNGSSRTVIDLSVLQDALSEPSETVVVRLTSPVGANLRIGFNLFTYTILDDESIPLASFSLPQYTGTEAVGIGKMEVRLAEVAAQNITVNYTVTPGTASIADFSVVGTSLTIPAGSLTGEITVIINQDVIQEGNESFQVTLTGPGVGTPATATFVIGDDDYSGFTGPGGVGDATVNRLWLRADRITAANGGPVNNWPDVSGNNATVNRGGTNSPVFLASSIGNRPAVQFTASQQHYFTLPNLSSFLQGEAFIISRAASDPPLASANTGFWSLGQSNTHYPWTNGNLYDAFGSTIQRANNVPVASLDIPRLYSVRSLPDLWENRLDGASLFSSTTNTVSFAASPTLGAGTGTLPIYFMDGVISEFVFYNQSLNTAQRLIVENYLAAKHLVNVATDLYSFEVNFGNDVAGIGRVDASNIHLAAQSAGMLKISSPSELGNGEFLLFGHDGASAAAWTTTEAPAGGINIQRLSREWILSETGDVGSVSIAINTSLLPAIPAGYSTYVVLVDADGDFSSGATVHALTSVGANEFEAVGINVNGSNRIAIAAIRPVIEFVSANASEFEQQSPGRFDVRLNFPLDRNVSVNYSITGGTAVNGTDYSLTPGVLTITTGNLTTQGSITLINDTQPESDETILLQLTGPSLGVSLGLNDNLIFTINDDDRNRKVHFAATTGTGGENVSPVSITVAFESPTQIDLVNPTTVEYTITGGTATVVDDAVASGVVTIPANQSSATFNLVVVDDLLSEADETVIISLVNPVNANLSTTQTEFTYTIIDNDAKPTVEFTTNLVLATELLGIGQVPVGLSAVSGQAVTVNYTVTPGTADAINDYLLSNGTLSIPAGTTLANIVPIIVDDVITEGGESFTITITSATGANLGTMLTVTVLISDNDNIGFTGPGGVGDALTNRFWLSADQITLNNLDPVLQWPDRSGNSSVVTSIGTGNPRFLQSSIGGRPAVEFIAVNQNFFRLPNLGSLSQGEVFAVLATNTDPPATTARSGLWHLGVNSVGHYPLTNGNLYESFGTTARKDNLPIALLNQPRIYGVRSLPSLWEARLDGTVVLNTTTNSVTFPTQPNLGGGPATPSAYFDGRMSEVIFYNQVLNSAQRLIVENYLAAKYQITIPVPSDFYAFEATHGSEVAGIGRLSSTSLHVKARSGSFLDIGSPTNLGDNEFLLFGHNNGSVASWTATGAPNSAFQRLSREWRVSETGDLGTVVMSFDISGWPAKPADFENYVIIVDDDGNLASGYTLLTPTFTSATTFDISINLANAQYIVVGVSQNITQQNGNFSNTSTWLSGVVPLSNQGAIIEHDVQLTSPTTVATMQIRTGTGQLRLGANTLTVSSGNLSISGGGQLVPGTGTVNYSQNGNQCVAPATYFNLTLSGSGTKTLCGNVVINNAVNFGAAVTLNTDIANNYSISLLGNWTGTGTFVPNLSTVTINGSTLQTLNVGGLTFYNLVMNKPSADLQISSSITVTNALTLTRGDIILGGQNLILGNSATISSGSVDSYVQATGAGAIRKNFATTGSTMSFPVGDATLLTPLSINFASATLTSAYVAVNLRNVVHPGVPNAGINRYWIVTPSGIASPNYTINYRYDQTDVIAGGDETIYRPVKFNGTLQSGTVADLDETTNTINWVGLTSFSDFTAESNAPLPVELLRFSGYFDNESNVLEWATATELNNSYFEIQRSTDGAEFVKIGKVDGAGTTNLQQEYLYVDNSPYSGKNYYQLKQVDFDNKASYSKTIVVDVNSTPLLTVSVSPNPATGDRVIATIKGAATGKLASISVTDLNGKTISAASFTPTQVQTKIEFESSYMASGFYVVTVSQGTQVAKTKLIVAK